MTTSLLTYSHSTVWHGRWAVTNVTRWRRHNARGASSGFGELTALRLAQQGYRVFGTSRREQPATPHQVEMLVLDVRSDASVHACIEKLLARTNRIDLLVNNAGLAQAGVIEETTTDHQHQLPGWEVAEMIVRVAHSRAPRLRYRVGSDALWVPRLKAVLPQAWFQAGMRRRFRVPRLARDKIPVPPLLPPDALRG